MSPAWFRAKKSASIGRLDAQGALSNKIIELLEAGAPASAKGTRANVTPQAELLLAILRKEIDRPDTPLGTSCLITGTRQDPNLVSQLRKEFATADSVDILCSFIKWSGVRIIEDSQEHSMNLVRGITQELS
jgi:hypothetical protein